MLCYKKAEAREWAKENMQGVANVVIPSFKLDLTGLNERGVRHDIRKEIEYGFWGCLLVGEVVITLAEYTQFVQWAHDEAKGKLVLIHHAVFNTLAQNIEAAQMAEQEGAQLALLTYPANFFPTTNKEIYDYTKAFCDATNMGVILFAVNRWGFDRIHPSGMDTELVKQMVTDIPNIVAIKCHRLDLWKRHAHELIVTFPVEDECLPLMGVIPLQFMGTSDSEYYGSMVPRLFNMGREGKYDEMMKLFWQIQPARSAHTTVANSIRAGANLAHRMVWKYQAWLQGYNGGPLRQPTMKIGDNHMRMLRDGLTKSGLKPTDDSDKQFFVGRNPA